MGVRVSGALGTVGQAIVLGGLSTPSRGARTPAGSVESLLDASVPRAAGVGKTADAVRTNACATGDRLPPGASHRALRYAQRPEVIRCYSASRSLTLVPWLRCSPSPRLRPNPPRPGVSRTYRTCPLPNRQLRRC